MSKVSEWIENIKSDYMSAQMAESASMVDIEMAKVGSKNIPKMCSILLAADKVLGIIREEYEGDSFIESWLNEYDKPVSEVCDEQDK